MLDDDLRAILCPDKLSSREWLDVVGAAHAADLKTTSTIMFGHCEGGYGAWAKHLAALRDLQGRQSAAAEPPEDPPGTA